MFVDFIPVNHIEKRLNILRSSILIFQIIGMFPDIQPQQGYFALSQRTVLVWGGDNSQIIIIQYQPCPAASKEQSSFYIL